MKNNEKPDILSRIRNIQLRRELTVLLALFVMISTSYVMIHPGEALNNNVARTFMFFEEEQGTEEENKGELINAGELLEKEREAEAVYTEAPAAENNADSQEEGSTASESQTTQPAEQNSYPPTSTPAESVTPVFDSTSVPVVSASTEPEEKETSEPTGSPESLVSASPESSENTETADPETGLSASPETTATAEPTLTPEPSPSATSETVDEVLYPAFSAEDIIPLEEDGTETEENVRVFIRAAEGTFPEGTTVKVVLVRDIKVLEAIEQAAVDKAKEEDKEVKVSQVQAVDITFYDKDGNEIQPKDEQKVAVTFKSALIKEAEDTTVVHVEQDENKENVTNTSVLDTVKNAADEELVEKIDSDEAVVIAESFSVYGFALTETISVDYLTTDGETYEITVDLTNVTNITSGAELDIRELTEAETNLYMSDVAKALGINADSITQAKLFDISIKKDGKEIQPNGKVGVEIKLKEDVFENAQVVHFGEQTEILDATTEGNIVSFETGGFSVYAVIGGPEPTARMKVNFHAYDENGDEKITSVYIKNDDTPEELEMILFDPGVGKLNEGETFRGWTFNENYTVTQATSVYDKDENPDGAMTIDDIRDWAQEKQAEGIVESDPITEYEVYPMILKNFEIRYLDRFGIAIDTDSAYMLRDDTSAQYTINMAYATNDDDYHFKGWITEEEEKISSPNPEPETVTIKVPSESDPDVFVDKDYLLYTNNTAIQLTGDITLNAHAPKGKWLIFHEMEKGATYVAPQFLEEGERPNMPADEDMHLLGYDFRGWYLDEEYTRPYNGAPINEKTDVYAKWEPTTWAPYTVIIWKQGLDGEYAYQESFQLYGPVGTEVEALNSLSIVNNNDADYLRVSGQNENHGAVNRSYQTVHSTTGASPNIVHHYYYAGTTTVSDYVGFNCARIDYTEKDDDGNAVPVVVDAAGTKVVNAYYDRIEYSVKLYLLRRNGNNYYHATYRRNTAANRPELEINNGNNGMQWEVGVNNYTNNDSRFPSNMEWERRGNEYYSYVEVKAKYGEDISAKWPKYGTLENLGNYKFTSWYTMNAAGFYKGSGSGLDSFKGIITIMDEQILGDITTAEGANYLIGRYDQNIAEYTYEIWRETLEGEDYSGYETTEKDGKTYYHDTAEDIYSRSSAKPSGAHAPSYRGFEYRGDLDVRPADPTGNNHYGQHYTIEFYYDRVVNPIVFRDGTYFNGNGKRLNGYSNRSADEQTEVIPYEENVSSYNKGGDNYNDTYQPAYPGFVLEGWYADDACTTPYVFNKMPDSSITVYAKWVQVEYRVFLHPEVPSGKTVFWGSDEQGMSFRVSYGGRVSLPEGVLVNPADHDVLDDSYEFAGWYRDPEYHMPFDGDAYVLNDGITVPYDKSEMTDEMNEYGEITGGGPTGSGWNSDAIYYDENTGRWVENDRWWITRKLDLYGKWIKKMDPGTGIQIIYDPNGGSDEVHDDTLYKDGTNAVVQSAPITPPKVEVEGEEVSRVFLYWVVQRWDEEHKTFVDFEHMKFVYPGDLFDVDYEIAQMVETTVIDPVTGEETIKTEYFIQLRAEYDDPDKETPTHIWWYSNFGDNEVVKLNDTDKEQDVENVKINEAVFIKPEDTFTRPGYTFLGWARVDSTDNQGDPIEGHPALHPELDEDDLFLKYVEASEGTKAHFEALNSKNEWVPVTQVAADERYPYHDLYAVWRPDYFKVTIKKIVNGFPADVAETRTYSVTYTYDEESGTKNLINYNNNPANIQTISEAVPYGAVVKVVEADEPAFEVEYSAVRLTNDKGVELDPPVDVTEEADGGYLIVGDTEITVTNTRIKVPVTVIKTDQSGNALEGAKFEFTGPDFDGQEGINYTSTIAEGGLDAIIVSSGFVGAGTYVMTETHAPAGYNQMDDSVTINAAPSQEGSFDMLVTVTFNGEIGTASAKRVDVKRPELGWIVTISNDAGIKLPNTGGPGTLIYTLSGIALMLGAALMYGFRMRRRERRLN